MDTVTYILKKPISHQDKTYEVLTFQPLTTGHMLLADREKNEFSRILTMVAAMADIPLLVASKIRMSEFNDIVEKIAPLLGETSNSEDGSTSLQ